MQGAKGFYRSTKRNFGKHEKFVMKTIKLGSLAMTERGSAGELWGQTEAIGWQSHSLASVEGVNLCGSVERVWNGSIPTARTNAQLGLCSEAGRKAAEAWWRSSGHWNCGTSDHMWMRGRRERDQCPNITVKCG